MYTDVIFNFVFVTNYSPLTYSISHPCFIARENLHTKEAKENSKKTKLKINQIDQQLKPIPATASGTRKQARLHNRKAQYY